MMRLLAALLMGFMVLGQMTQAQTGPLRIEITEGVISRFLMRCRNLSLKVQVRTAWPPIWLASWPKT